jgi:hypothetical protein
MNEDDDWFEALAGRPAAAGAARAEAQALREALLRWPEAGPALDAAAARAAEDRLIERARQQGLLGPARCAGCAERAHRLRALWQGLARPKWVAGGLVTAALALWLVLPQQPVPGPEADAPAVLRAGPDGVVMLASEQPAVLRDRIAAELAAAGVGSIQRYQRLGRAGLDATLPQPLPPAVAAVLQQHRLPAPADGVLRVEVAQRAAR